MLFVQPGAAYLEKQRTAGKVLRQFTVLCYSCVIMKPAFTAPIFLQGMLEDFHGNATASGLSLAATQTLRNSCTGGL